MKYFGQNIILRASILENAKTIKQCEQVPQKWKTMQHSCSENAKMENYCFQK
jgi:hypothetical protein